MKKNKDLIETVLAAFRIRLLQIEYERTADHTDKACIEARMEKTKAGII